MLRKRVVAVACAVAVTGGLVAPVQAAQAARAKPAKVRIYKVYYDSPGADRGGNSSLNNEWVALKNYGGKAANLYRYTLRDRSNHVYRFGRVWLKAGKRIYVHTGRGRNGKTHVYQGRRWYVWNNTRDAATLRTRYGTRIDVCSWNSSSRNWKYC